MHSVSPTFGIARSQYLVHGQLQDEMVQAAQPRIVSGRVRVAIPVNSCHACPIAWAPM